MSLVDRARELLRRALESRIFRDSSVLLVGNWVSTGLSIVGSIVLARLLEPTGYGQVILATTIVSTIIQFLDIRTAEGLIHFVGQALARGEPREAVSYFYVGLSVDVLLMLATLVLAVFVAPLAAGAYPDGELLRELVSIYVLTIPFVTLEGTFQAVLNIFKRFTLLAAGSLLFSLMQLVILVLAARSGVVAVMWGYVIASALSLVMWIAFGLPLLVRNIRAMGGSLRPQGYRSALRSFLPFAFYTSVTASIKAVTANVDMLVLGALRPVADVGYFRIARSAASLITMPTSQVSVVIYPELNEAWARGQLARARDLIKRYSLVTLVASSAALLFYVFAAEWLVRLFYGQDYFEAAPLIARLIVLLGVGIVLESVFRWVRPATMAQGKPQLTTFYSTAQIVLRLVLLVPLVYLFGAIGAALTYDLAVIWTVLLILFYVMPRLGLRVSLRPRAEVPGSIDPEPPEG